METKADLTPEQKWWENHWAIAGICAILGVNALLVLYSSYFMHTLIGIGSPRNLVLHPAAWFGVAMILPTALAVGYARGMPKSDGRFRRMLPLLTVLTMAALGVIQLAAWCL